MKENKILTIPNIMSIFRIILIPFIIVTYRKELRLVTMALLVLSWLTDILDGMIARHFNMISNLGKALDPVADKMTQGFLILELISDFPIMAVLFAVFILIQIVMIADGILVIRKTGTTYSAGWQGKFATGVLDAVIIIHVAWCSIGNNVSTFLIVLSIAMMVLSLCLYLVQNKERISGAGKRQAS